MSCSQVIAIPPCIWTASAATLENASLAATRASAADVADGSVTASLTTARADCTATYRSAIRCLSAWTADRAAKLDTVLGVFHGQVQTLRCGADLLGSQQDRSGVGEPGIGADIRGGRGLDPRESPRQVHGLDAVRGEIRPAAQCRTRGRDHDIGHVTIDHITGVEHDRPDPRAL